MLSAELVGAIAAVFSTLDPGEAVGVRVPFGEDRASTPVERLVERVATRLQRRVIRFSPTKGGRAATFFRDYDLVTGASEVVAYFSPEREMEGGTGHVVKAALDRGVKVEAYSVRPDGALVFLGSEDARTDQQVQPAPGSVLERMWQEAQQE